MAPKGTVFSSEKCLTYRFPGHPERPERVGKTLEHLKSLGFNIKTPKTATEEDALRVHSKKHIDCLKHGEYIDADTPFSPGMVARALLSLGGSLSAMESAAFEGVPSFSLMRPPGHHAGTLSGISGFCYINNIAVAVTKSLETFSRVAILDIDVHHGNGTQEIFIGNPKVIFCSIHQSPLYPGSGISSEKNCLNYLVKDGTEEKLYLKILDQALEKIQDFKPELLAVSAGFDTYVRDPLAGLKLEIETYKTIGSRISSLGIPRFSLLEGGYSEDLPYCVESFLNGFL